MKPKPQPPYGAEEVANNGDNRLMHYQDGNVNDIYFQRKYFNRGKWITKEVIPHVDGHAVISPDEIQRLADIYFD